MPDNGPSDYLRAARVLVGDSVWEDVQLVIRDGWLHIDFEADGLDPIAISPEGLAGVAMFMAYPSHYKRSESQ